MGSVVQVCPWSGALRRPFGTSFHLWATRRNFWRQLWGVLTGKPGQAQFEQPCIWMHSVWGISADQHGGFLKRGTPKTDGLLWKMPFKLSEGTPICGNPHIEPSHSAFIIRCPFGSVPKSSGRLRNSLLMEESKLTRRYK